MYTEGKVLCILILIYGNENIENFCVWDNDCEVEVIGVRYSGYIGVGVTCVTYVEVKLIFWNFWPLNLFYGTTWGSFS